MRASAPGEVGVLVVEEEAFVEQPDLLEVTAAKQDTAAASREDLGGLVVLTLVALQEASIGSEAELHQL